MWKEISATRGPVMEGAMALGFPDGEVVAGVTGTRRKRAPMDPDDRAVVQRQKCMIKNRESAARSRDRKQAYVAELELQVSQLEEEQAELLREQSWVYCWFYSVQWRTSQSWNRRSRS